MNVVSVQALKEGGGRQVMLSYLRDPQPTCLSYQDRSRFYNLLDVTMSD